MFMGRWCGGGGLRRRTRGGQLVPPGAVDLHENAGVSEVVQGAVVVQLGGVINTTQLGAGSQQVLHQLVGFGLEFGGHGGRCGGGHGASGKQLQSSAARA